MFRKKKQKKNIHKIFEEDKLDIATQCNMEIVDYSDVSLNLNNSNCKLYHKPDNEILYIHKDSNRWPNILKQIPTSTEKRISTLSSNETIFNELKNIYQKALEKFGYRQTLKFHPASEMPATTNQIENEIIFCYLV